MVEIPDSLRSVFTATVRERDGDHVLEIPPGEIAHDALSPGESYRVAVLDAPETPDREGRDVRSGDGARRTGRRSAPEPPVEEGEIRAVTIETVGDHGDGIAKVDRGYVVIVPGARPGDEPTVEIDQVRQNVAFATVVDSDGRTP
jgi:predicted RNA-binding protein with TRAM domain